MAEIPAFIRQARAQWEYRGHVRPAFAERVNDDQESVWDYPRPPRVATDDREVVVKRNGALIAQTNSALRVLETASPPTYYLPPNDVRVNLLEEAPGNSLCEWKGEAHYWSIVLPECEPFPNAVWSYEDPFEGFEQIARYFSFYPEMLECYVGGRRVEPQPGNIYGGWVTPEVVGPFKGDAGTENW